MTREATYDFGYVRDLIREQAALVIEEDKKYLVETRLGPLAQREGYDSIEALVEGAKASMGAALRTQVVEAMTTNETSFFRDRHPFETLRNHVLPELFESRSFKRLNIWSAACSSGQEAYSVAMLLKESFVDECRNWHIQIKGTDIDTAILERAREGLYSQVEVNRGLPAPLLVKYFEREGARWRIDSELRRMVRFSQMNLAKPWTGVSDMDVILLRNVLIYFNLDTKREILERAHQKLRPGGYLFLGGCETALNVHLGWVAEQLGDSLVYRRAP